MLLDSSPHKIISGRRRMGEGRRMKHKPEVAVQRSVLVFGMVLVIIAAS